MPNRDDIAARVRALRKEAGSHDKLAKALGRPTTRQAVIRHEHTGRMKRVMAERYAEFTKTEPEDWLEDEDVIEIPMAAFLEVVRRLETIAERLEARLELQRDQEHSQSG